jgi:hypothetical protein
MSAIYDATDGERHLLVKVFARGWSRHTRDFCRWTYGEGPLSFNRVAGIAAALPGYQARLRAYGLLVEAPLGIWAIRDPFVAAGSDWALAVAVRRSDAPTAHECLLAHRTEAREVLSLLAEHLEVVVPVIGAAIEQGDVRNHLVACGFDPKPRNFISGAGRWLYIDSFPVLDASVLRNYRSDAPPKAVAKRFDVRYYVFDLLMRYYRVAPVLIDDLRRVVRDALARRASWAEPFDVYVDEAIEAYIAKWGHMVPDEG